MRILNTNEILSNRILIPKWKYQCNTEVLTVPFQLNTCYSTVVKKKFAYCLWSFCDVFFSLLCVHRFNILYNIIYLYICSRSKSPVERKRRGVAWHLKLQFKRSLLWNFKLEYCPKIDIRSKIYKGPHHEWWRTPHDEGCRPPTTEGAP